MSLPVPNKLLLKIIVLGESNVGKTCLITRFVRDEFIGNYKETIGADFSTKEIELGDKLVTLQIWDTAGQERFQSLGSIFYRGADACVLVYDISSTNSFTNLGLWRENFLEKSNLTQTLGFPFLVIGNKTDLESSRKVNSQEAREWCKQHNIQSYFETSAKDASNVEQAFRTIALEAKNYQTKSSTPEPGHHLYPVEDVFPKTDEKPKSCRC
eukprot:TRINITY_DN504_c0_g1_i1.p1 TRINITY_DN504_c0_g1~~TRINITY_DN504_c0_g1_i1.p1  ORF type:complete len:212 (-),score=37.35 TRINITY_DN504_c0_g1_i1:119-754(-)